MALSSQRELDHDFGVLGVTQRNERRSLASCEDDTCQMTKLPITLATYALSFFKKLQHMLSDNQTLVWETIKNNLKFKTEKDLGRIWQLSPTNKDEDNRT